MIYAISSQGGFRVVADANQLVDGEYIYEGVIPGNPYDVMDSGLIIENTSVRAKTGMEMAVAAKIVQLKLACQAQIQSGFNSDALGATYHYESRMPQDQSNLIGARLSEIDREYTCIEVATGIKSRRMHTAGQIAQVFNDGAAWMDGAIAHLYSKLGEIQVATSETEINAITW